ncbi:MAG: OmpA family protein [Spirochaetaceae bacterium]|nr:OmpA family protein [Spirochaetaceae bacterium]
MRRFGDYMLIRVAFVILISSLGAPLFFAQNVGSARTSSVVTSPSTGGTIQLANTFDGTYTLVERSNWSQYVNGRYIGLTSREARGYLNPTGSDSWRGQSGTQYTGDFFVFQQTKRDNRTAAQGIDDILPSSFVMLGDGSVQFTELCFYPQLRNFPVFPQEKVKKGSRWQGMAERVVDPRNDKQFTVLEVPVEYEFVGEELYKGQPVYRIKAKFATRFNKYNPPRIIDSQLSQATGTHDVDILVDKETCAVMMMLDRLDETFTYRNGETIRYKGTTSLFTEIPVQVDKKELYERAVYIARGEEPPAGSSLAKKDDGTGGGSGRRPKETNSSDGFGGSGFESGSGSAGSGKTGSSGSTGGSAGGKGTGSTDSSGRDSGSTGSKDESFGSGAGSGNTDPSKSGSGSDGGSGGMGSTDKKPGSDKLPATDKQQDGMFQVEDTDKGVRLSVRDLKFVADSAQLLPQERGRLDAVAEVLKSVPGGTFLIEGHTAAVGRPAGEQQLSEERAQSVIAELVKRGLKAEQFMFKGYGGTQPVGDNNTDAGRAANRRVEITILQ